MAEQNLGIPGALFRTYEDSLNRQTDLLFWRETGYKLNQRLNPADPRDREMIPRWWAARTRVARRSSPRDLIRAGAVEKVLALRQQGDSQPIFLYTAGAGGSDTRTFMDGEQVEKYLGQHLHDVSYAAIFNAKDSRWPLPMYETYPQGEIEIDQPPATVSGAARGSYRNVFARARLGGAAPSVIHYEGMALRPLTAEVVARMSDLDPARRDATATGRAWIDFDGNRRPAKLIRDVFQPGDALYYWDGPWGFLTGSRGIAVVRGGTVVETFTTMMS